MSIPRIVNVIRNQNTGLNQNNDLLGVVSSSSPLIVKTNGIELDREQLKVINNQILQTGDEVLLIRVGAFFIVIGKVVTP